MPCASGAKRAGGEEREKSAKEKKEGCRLDGENNVQVLVLWLVWKNKFIIFHSTHPTLSSEVIMYASQLLNLIIPSLRYRAFSLTWPASMLIYWNKRKFLRKKRVQFPQGCLRTPTWPPFHCFGTPIWPPWRHVKTFFPTSAVHRFKWDSSCC